MKKPGHPRRRERSLVGLISALLIVPFSPSVWADTSKLGLAPFSYAYPALFSVSLEFLVS